MSELTPEQQSLILKAMRDYLDARRDPDGLPLVEVQAERDTLRVETIDQHLQPLLDGFLSGSIPLREFKSTVDGFNKRQGYWGFSGIKGQMFFNMLINVANDEAECDAELKAALVVPTSEDMARSRINTFVSYVKRLGDQHLEAGGSKMGRPKFRSSLFFLSYFWHIHDRHTWPVYYTSSANTMTDLNLWQPSDDLAGTYIQFKHIHEELADLFTRESGKPFGLYEVEHVFWFKGGHPFKGKQKVITPKPGNGDEPSTNGKKQLPDSYVPPIVAVLPDMAQHGEAFIEAAKASGTSLERAFEKSIHAAFTILGYETQLLGQGAGRVQDGTAIDYDHGYALLWDAKVRKDGYSMGTDDRTIREYITTQARDFKKKRSLRNIYYLIVSSGFKDDFDDTICSLKMDTDVSEVCLVEADALVAMVDAKLRDPQQLTLGSDGLQRLFSNSGVLTAERVGEVLT